MKRITRIGVAVLAFLSAGRGFAQDAPLPDDVKIVWDLDKAQREKTPTRERVCLNGLWRWQPGGAKADAIPENAWGYFKVPGFWPGASSYIQEDCQTLHAHPNWKNADVRNLSAAWYQREFTVPDNWNGRRITIATECVNSFAVVFIDGKKAGEIRFPAGEVDVTAQCKPNTRYTLSIYVVALPLKGVLLSYNDTNAARAVKGTVERRGLCGDVWLTSTPQGPRITHIKVDPSVRKGTLSVSANVEGLNADELCVLELDVREGPKSVHEFKSDAFKAAELVNGRITLTDKWRPAKYWDVNTQAMVTLQATLVGPERKVLDVADPVSFGFREFWIDGKDFYLNGTRIFLSAVPLDNAQIGARTASYEGALETMKRLKSFGINFVYTHNYGCQPGSHLAFNEVLRAADDIGMLVGFSQPHFGHYDWKDKDADANYAKHAEYYVRAAQNHPSVVMYSMSHNATGYDEDMNPDLIDGVHDPRKDGWSLNNSKLALRAEGIVKKLDPERIVYHHSSGNLGSMHTSNFYLNFAPIQEVSDWFGHWATNGVKPMFPVEYGVPFSWDWTMYRGWYNGERNFGSAKVPWEFCLAEWNAQFQGDRAYQISEREKQNVRFEAKQFKEGKLWHRWDYPHHVGSRDFDERGDVFARYITDNWRAFRTWGLSANSPWEYQAYWKLKDGVNKGRRDFKVNWDTLQKPGFSADYTHRQNWQMATDFEASDWIPTAPALALLRNNQPVLAYIAGKKDAFTSKERNYRPGDKIEKQLVIINNSRETVTCDCVWSLDRNELGKRRIFVTPGQQERYLLRLPLAPTFRPGSYDLTATFRISGGETQTDSIKIHVLPPPNDLPALPKIALFDPKGETTKLLKGLDVKTTRVDARANLAGYDMLIVGKDALTVDGAAPDVMRVRDGLKVIIFEQSAKTLEQRFGFRVAEYGLREVFPRVPDHPLLKGLKTEHLRDWRGEATLSSSRLEYTTRPRYGPTVKWCDIDVPRLWRCGCRGNVASVLIEKPACGDFLSIVDGGYALQYSTLVEYREGKGLVLFCQMDVTGRTEIDPAGDVLARNIISYVADWSPRPSRKLIYAGEPAGKDHLQAAGFTVEAFTKDALTPASVLIVGPGGGRQLSGDAGHIADWLKMGGRVLAIGLDEGDAKAFLPSGVIMKKNEYIGAAFAAPGIKSLLAGVGPGDLHNRDPRMVNLVEPDGAILGGGVLAQHGNVVFLQMAPWHFDPAKTMNLKRTFRRVSFTATRLASNLGAIGETPILGRFHAPPKDGERRWLRGMYLDVPGEWDDPYRFFRW